MSPDTLRLSPEQHIWVRCRCGEPVHLPAFAEATVTCRCGRRFSFDTELLTIVRPEGQREDMA